MKLPYLLQTMIFFFVGHWYGMTTPYKPSQDILENWGGVGVGGMKHFWSAKHLALHLLAKDILN